ncbi:hypothetical protein PRNP1_003003 [Phytophthora ramorum]
MLRGFRFSTTPISPFSLRTPTIGRKCGASFHWWWGLDAWPAGFQARHLLQSSSPNKTFNMADYDEEEVTRGVTVRDVKPADFIKAYAEHLKRSGKIELPAWWDVVKTAAFKEYSPATRTGTTSAPRPSRRQHFQKASGGLIRHILQQLEEMKVVEKCPEGVNKGGRKISSHGQQDLDRIAGQVVRA